MNINTHLMKTKLFASLIFLLAIVISSFFAWVVIDYYFDNDDAIHIAFVGPLTGKDAEKGQTMLKALKMYTDNFNKNENTQQKIVIVDFDDKNDPETAKEKAKEIVDSDAVAVIGHIRSDCSVEGAEIYHEKILAITPASYQTKITQKNDWYFRTFYNNEVQARFLVRYAKKFLLQPHNTVSIIYLDTIYGRELADLFKQISQEMNVKIKNDWSLPNLKNDASEQEQKQLEQRITYIVSELQKNISDGDIIFLATQSNGGVKLIKKIRDANIQNKLITPETYANIQAMFKNEPKEKKAPGYYTNGIWVASFLSDRFKQSAKHFNSKYQKKYQQNLPSAAFYAVDALQLIIEAIQKESKEEPPKSRESYRERLKKSLAKIDTKKDAVKGVTGALFFNEKGDISKPLSMGIYRNNRLVSAPLQLRADGDDTRYKTVVYTGVQFNKISEIDLNTGTNKLDFYLWFRFKETNGPVIKPQDIEFINAVSEVKMEKIEPKDIDGQTYLLYRVKDQLFYENRVQRKKHVFFNIVHALGVSFRHRHLNQEALIYVHDVLGTSSLKTDEHPKLEKTEGISLNPWKVQEIQFFHNITKQTFLGHPKYLVEEPNYSTFNAHVWIRSHVFIYQDIIAHHIISHRSISKLLIFTAIITLLLFIVSYADRYLRFLWFVQAIFAVLLLVSIEIFLDHIREETYLEYLKYIDTDIETIRAFVLTTFEILWWLIPAILLDMAVRRFLWIPLEEKTERPIPGLMRFLISFIIYSLACFGVIAFVFEQPITSLLATGGLLTAVIGFALKTNLSNIFSGIALSIERSFRVGDWVKIGTDEGQVVDMNWRVTNIQTRGRHILSIPNSKVAASNIHNFSYPDNQYWLKCPVYIAPKYDPGKIEEILIRAVLSVKEDVLTDSKPVILFNGVITTRENVNHFVVSYAVFFKTENYQYKGRVLKNVWRSIWSHLSQAGIIVVTSPYEKDEAEKPVALTSTELKQVLTKDHLQNLVK
jgi:potassium-dependent mechanosensitive channel